MSHARRTGWIVLCLSLFVLAALAGTALGAQQTPDCEPEPTLPPGTPSPTCYARLYFQPFSNNISVGQTTWIQVMIADVANLHKVEVSVPYDPSIIELIPRGGGAAWEPGYYPQPQTISKNDDQGPGLLRYAAASSPECTANGGGRVCKFNVRGLAPGTVHLALTTHMLQDGANQPIAHTVSTYDFVVVGNGDATPTKTKTPTGDATPKPTKTPATASTKTATPTEEPLDRMIFGVVADTAGAPVTNAQVALYRNTNGSWTHMATRPSAADGVFRLWANPIPGTYKLIITPPAGYTAESAALPAGVTGEVVSSVRVEFALDDQPGEVGAFTFTLAPPPTATPTLEPWQEPTIPVREVGGRVMQGGRPLQGVLVTLRPQVEGHWLNEDQTAITDADGYYSFSVAPGIYTVSLHDPAGRIPDQTQEVDADAWDPGPIDWENWQAWLPMLMVAEIKQ